MIIKVLDIYTNHGDFILIPHLDHANADSLIANSDEDYLQYFIVDSIYADEKMPGTVVMQYPKAGAKVKKGRKIYLSIVAKTPEMVAMPNLIDLSIRRAVDVVQYAHLQIQEIQFEDDIALNAVIKQMINDRIVPPDSLLPSGTKIILVAGNGYNKTGIPLPFLIGKTANQARQLILKSSFNMGAIDTLSEDYAGDWKVYEQTPFADPLKVETFELGSRISIKLRSAHHFNFDSLLGFYNLPDSLRYDTVMMNEENFDF